MGLGKEHLLLDTVLSPVWKGNIVFDESALVLRNKVGNILPISLMYPITEIVSVRDSSLKIIYEEGRDYKIKEGKLVIPEGSRVPVLEYNNYYLSEKAEGKSLSAQNGGYLFYSEDGTFHKKQISITYRHDSTFGGSMPEPQGHKVKNTLDKLEKNKELKVVFYGDSITVGANCSSFLKVEPHMPSWTELVIQALKERYQNEKLTFINSAVGGMTSQWGAKNVKTHVIKFDPDLVFIGFGMNDSWDQEEYKENIKKIIMTVHENNQNCEFVLIAPMLPNREIAGFYYFQDKFVTVLHELAQEYSGVAVADVTQMHIRLLEKKHYYDMTGNNVNHPNDFLARIYAQIIMEIFRKTSC